MRDGQNQGAEVRLTGWLIALAVATAFAAACDDPAKHDDGARCDAAAKCAPGTARSGVGRNRCEQSCGDESPPDAARDAGSDAGCAARGDCPTVVPPDRDARVPPDAETPTSDAGDAGHDAGDAGDAGDVEPVDPTVIGVDFIPVETVTTDGQTVAHLALTGLINLPNDRGVLVWEKSGRIAHYLIDGDRFVLQGEIRFTGYY
ncbi:MAG TPA: hypothetical protein VK509_25320, partial [Polyangiales bacterium]|nr:hypothetical protein [Polyangiales bacterium]